MAYDSELADRIRALVAGEGGITEKRMFGGLAFLLHGNMAVAASGQGGLLVRVDPGASADLVENPGVALMVMRGREMAGWLRVDRQADANDIGEWVERGVRYARSLPPKPG
jgi:TfoX/Sxy family transcriptional regulator of competence genes